MSLCICAVSPEILHCLYTRRQEVDEGSDQAQDETGSPFNPLIHDNALIIFTPLKYCALGYILREKSLAIYFGDSQYRRNGTFNFTVSKIYVDKRSRVR